MPLKLGRNNRYSTDKLYTAHIKLLDNTIIDINLPQSAKGKDCLEKISSKLGLHEVCFVQIFILKLLQWCVFYIFLSFSGCWKPILKVYDVLSLFYCFVFLSSVERYVTKCWNFTIVRKFSLYLSVFQRCNWMMVIAWFRIKCV